MGFFSESQLAPFQQTVPEPGAPILLNRPKALSAYRNRLTDTYAPLLEQGGDPSTINPLINLDVRNVERGQMPMSQRQIINAYRAGLATPENPNGQAINPVPERGTGILDLPANAVSDLREIFTSIPKLPFAMVKEIQRLPEAPQLLAEGLADPAKLKDVPGLSLVPGVYTLSNVLGGQADELMKHPLFTALDVAPYAKARVFDAPASMLDEAGNLSRRPDLFREMFPDTRVTQRAVNREIGRNMMGDTGKVSIVDLAANTKPGRVVGNLKDRAKIAAASTRPGQEVMAALGQSSRNLTIARNHQQRMIVDMLDNPQSVMWDDSAQSRAYNNAFEPFRDSSHALQEWEAKWGDDFGKETYGSVDAWKARRQELGRMVQLEPGKIASLPEHEQTMLREAGEVADKWMEPLTSTDINTPAAYGRVEFTTPDGNVTSEILPWDQAKNVWKMRAQVAAVDEMRFLREAVENPGLVTEQQLLDRAATSDVLRSTTTPAKLQAKVYAGYAHALNARGVNARSFLRQVNQAAYGKVPMPVLQELQELSDRLPPGLDPPMVLDQLDEAVQPRVPSTRTRTGYKRTDIEPAMEELRGLLRARTTDYTLLKKTFNRIFDKQVAGKIEVPESFAALDRDVVNASIDLMRERSRWLGSDEIRTLTSDTAGRQLAKKLIKLESKSAPARFFPKIGELADQRMVELADELTNGFYAGDPVAGERLAAVMSGGDIGNLGSIDDLTTAATGKSASELYRGFAKEARDSWMTLVDEGFDPQFVHHVPVGKGGRVKYASVNLSAKKPGSWKQRTLEMVPAESDIALALKANALDTLTKLGDDHLIDIITQGSPSEGWLRVARTRTELLNSLQPIIDAEMLKRPGQLRREVEAEVLARTYVPFDAQRSRSLPISPEQNVYAAGARATPGKTTGIAATEQLYIPKSLNRVIEQIQTPATARAVWDPVMQVFRTSTLILSPRWQIYNLLGNGLTGMMSSSPWDFLKELPKSVDILKRVTKHEATPELSIGMRGSLGQAGKPELEYAALAGEAMSDVVARAPEAVQQAVRNWGKPIGRGFTATQDFLVRMNAMVDDVTRISNYLVGEGKAMKAIDAETMRGVDTLAKRAGSKGPNALDMRRVEAENLMRDWTYNWDQMTPWERSTARFVFPFYGFFSHILRYSKRYAIDHPFRVAMMASFARNELEDWGTGLPERLHNMLLIGGRDEDGNQLGINFGGWNPFADTANLFSLTGWMSQVNPLISTMAEQFGIDTRTGEAGVYPATAYDPVTGRLSISPPNPLTSLLQNVIPQTQALSMLLGSNEDLRATNPDAAGRMALSSLGVPVLARQVNVPQEITQAELARENAARQAFSTALSTGSTGPLRAYPQLEQQMIKLQTTQAQNPTQFAAMTRGISPAGYLDLAQRALIPGGG